MATNGLQCPRCAAELQHVRIRGVDVDVCEECCGVWLDRLEIGKFDDPAAAVGDALVAHLQQFPRVLIDHAVRLHCPRHRTAVMLRRDYSRTVRIPIDECPECAGIWLDSDELAQIRRKKATAPNA